MSVLTDFFTALITISTRASLKRYHTYTLTLGMGERGDEWEIQRIGTESEKSSVEKELAELRERLAKVEEWKARRQEIEEELNRVWVDGGNELAPPPYAESQKDHEQDSNDESRDASSNMPDVEPSHASGAPAWAGEKSE